MSDATASARTEGDLQVTQHSSESYDYVIVGGGSAGCVLANRLSARAGVRVALIEAGADTPPGAVPPEIEDSYPMPVFCGERFIWPTLQARATRRAPLKVYEQGRVMGGGSSVNVQSANRGLPRDYDEWAEMGAVGWSWREVLPYFRRLERDLDFPDSPLHGRDGPMPIRRIPAARWPAFGHAFADGLRAFGLPELANQNGEFGDGLFASAFSNEAECRATSASAYLDAATRQRPNLHIFSSTRVRALRFATHGGKPRVVGVAACDAQGRALQFAARETLVCAGALQSPALLLRAGIGDPDALCGAGVAPRLALPGVGRNLQDHPSLTFCHYLPRALRTPLAYRRASMVAARLSSGIAQDASDLYLSSATRAAWHALGARLGLFFLWCNRPRSRGSVTLRSPDPDMMPEVHLNLLDAPEDLARLASGVRQLAQIVAASTLGGERRDFFPASFSPRVKRLSRYTRSNDWITRVLGAVLDAPAPVRRWVLDRFVARGVYVADLARDDAALERFIESHVFGVWHASGTCRMGAAEDPMAVTDTAGRVHRCDGLRVIDASLMPRLPSANTNIPTLMMAEKIAAHMLGEAA